jgi:hypothetical protein
MNEPEEKGKSADLYQGIASAMPPAITLNEPFKASGE